MIFKIQIDIKANCLINFYRRENNSLKIKSASVFTVVQQETGSVKLDCFFLHERLISNFYFK